MCLISISLFCLISISLFFFSVAEFDILALSTPAKNLGNRGTFFHRHLARPLWTSTKNLGNRGPFFHRHLARLFLAILDLPTHFEWKEWGSFVCQFFLSKSLFMRLSLSLHLITFQFPLSIAMLLEILYAMLSRANKKVGNSWCFYSFNKSIHE